MAAPARDDDPVHPTWDGIVFISTTDHKGVVCTCAVANGAPPISYLPLPVAVAVAGDLEGIIGRIREGDASSYMADFLDMLLTDFKAAITACQPEKTH